MNPRINLIIALGALLAITGGIFVTVPETPSKGVLKELLGKLNPDRTKTISDSKSIPSPDRTKTQQGKTLQPGLSWGMKLVNETVTDEDLDKLRELGFTTLEGEWGMDEANPATVLRLLDRLHARGMKLIINFSEEAAWGYSSSGSEQSSVEEPIPPVWQQERVQHYIEAIMRHPGIYGYDISNEGGENLPAGTRYPITLEQLRQAAYSISTIDPSRPLILRMHYWDKEDGDFSEKNPFAADIVDVVILNLYSNYSTNLTTPLIPNMVARDGQKLVNKIRKADPNTRVWISLAAFSERPSFVKPSAKDLQRDIEAASKITGIENISFFGWGPERYPTEPPGWYLPRDAPEFLQIFKETLPQT